MKGLTEALLHTLGLKEDVPRPLTVCQHTTLRYPVASSIKVSQVPETSLESLEMMKEEYQWLDNASEVIESKSTAYSLDTSWAAFHASRQTPGIRATCSIVLLPLFLESAHTVAMIKHSLEVISKAVGHLNPGQSPVVTFDQPLYALAKQIQFKWPEKYEDKLVVMFGGLHIEMAALKMLGNWLQGSGWVEALVQAGISSQGKADSFWTCLPDAFIIQYGTLQCGTVQYSTAWHSTVL